MAKTLEAIKYTRPGKLRILDQLLLPGQCVYIDINNVQDAWHAIKDMKVLFYPLSDGRDALLTYKH